MRYALAALIVTLTFASPVIAQKCKQDSVVTIHAEEIFMKGVTTPHALTETVKDLIAGTFSTGIEKDLKRLSSCIVFTIRVENQTEAFSYKPTVAASLRWEAYDSTGTIIGSGSSFERANGANLVEPKDMAIADTFIRATKNLGLFLKL